MSKIKRKYLDFEIYTQEEVTTISGVLQDGIDANTSDIATVSGSIVTNHSELNELDYASAGHTGFASTEALVTTSGVIVAQIPSTDGYEGRQVVTSGTNTVDIDIGVVLGNTEYSPVISIENVVDSPMSIFAYGITTTTTSGFTVELSGNVPTGNYVLNWRVGGSYLLAEEISVVNYGPIITIDDTHVGETMTVVVDDASSVFGSVLYQAADFHYDRADADSSSTSPVFVIAVEAGAGSKVVVVRGQVCDTGWNWSSGKVYLSTTTGEMTQVIPSGSGDQVQVLGWALSATTIFFDPVTMIIEVA